MTRTRLNPTIENTNGVTITANSGFTVSTSNRRKYGRVVSLFLTITTTNAIAQDANMNPFSCNLTNGANISSNECAGYITNAGNCWLKATTPWAANSSHNMVLIGLL